MILAASLLWSLANAYASSALFTANTIQTDRTVLMQSGFEALSLAPLMVACAVAAWGPWPPVARAVLLMVAVAVAVAIIHFAQGQDFVERLPRVTEVLWISQDYLSVFHVVASSSVCLWILGSMLQIRLGPAELGPTRMTILGMMAATAILGLLIVVTATVDLKMHQAIFSQPHMSPSSPNPEPMYMSRALLSVLIGGPLIALYIGLCAAARSRWSARIILVLLPIALGLLHFRLTQDTVTPSGTSLVGAMMILVFGGWVAGSFWMLDRSGWKLSRRQASERNGVTALSGPESPTLPEGE